MPNFTRLWQTKDIHALQNEAGPVVALSFIIAAIAGFFPIAEVAELVNIGTPSAFILVCTAIIVLRYRKPTLQRGFRCPGMPVVPLLGIGFSIWLIMNLAAITWLRFIVWMAIGLIIYFGYGIRHSKLNQIKTETD